MLEVTPAAVHFPNIAIHQTYTAQIAIRNPFPSTVELQLKCSSSKYSLSTSKCVIPSHQSYQILIQLQVHTIPHKHYTSNDWLFIRSMNIYQKIPLSFSVQPLDGRQEKSLPGFSSLKSISASGIDIQDESRLERLEAIIRQLESRHPNLEELVRLRVEEECKVFEDKSEEVLRILQRKDERIELLERKLRMLSEGVSMDKHTDLAVEGMAQQLKAAEAAAARERNEHEETMQVLEDLQRAYEALRKEKKAIEGQNASLSERVMDQQEHIARLTSQLRHGRDEEALDIMVANTTADERASHRIQQNLEEYQKK